MSNPDHPDKAPNEFEQAAAEERISFTAELWDFLKHNKKWWLLPIFICMAGLIALLIMSAAGGGAAAPFIYTLF
ncbi:MAG: hypothetical protein H6819_12635 [Phycisphaerales bacterium]|nr:hypothetical protein [Phycisphaerales bacterium]MCB9862222.1 hypothetical protein [Phycisphaerales bacterium]